MRYWRLSYYGPVLSVHEDAHACSTLPSTARATLTDVAAGWSVDGALGDCGSLGRELAEDLQAVNVTRKLAAPNTLRESLARRTHKPPLRSLLARLPPYGPSNRPSASQRRHPHLSSRYPEEHRRQWSAPRLIRQSGSPTPKSGCTQTAARSHTGGVRGSCRR